MESPTWTKRTLGSTGMAVTPLGIGGGYLGVRNGKLDERVGVETVLRGLELGLNLIDSSGAYIGGKSERMIGMALLEWYQRGGRREDLILSTKTGTRSREARDYTYAGTVSSVETSLELLQTDYIDILHVHDPIDLDPVFVSDGALAALKDLKANSVIRAIGLGCRQHEFHQRCIASDEFDVSLTFHDYNLAVQTADQGVIQPATEKGMGVFNATVTLNGLLTDGDPMARWRERDRLWERHLAQMSPDRLEWARERRVQDKEQAERAAQLWEWCQMRKISLLALNLQFCLRDPRIASTLIGFARPARVEEDIAACWVPIPEDTWDKLYETFHLRRAV